MTTPAASPAPAPPRKTPWRALALLILWAVFMFAAVLNPQAVLFSTDDNLGATTWRATMLPEGLAGAWDPSALLGQPTSFSASLTNLLLWILPTSVFINWIHAFYLAGASFFLLLYLRHWRLAWSACALATLTAFWLGNNFTLTYAGHIPKFAILMWVCAYLWLIERASARRSAAQAILAGFVLGLQFGEQPDVALFCALVLGAYTLFVLWRDHRRAPALWLRLLAPLLLVALLMAVHPLYSGYRTAVQDMASLNPADPDAQWDFCTQWSWPPEESIDFVAPGYMGWRSGEPAGPYWGRMGRSAGWEQTRRGFLNFKLENQYLGAIPVLFALTGLLLAWRRHPPGATATAPADPWQLTLRCWTLITLVTLLLAFGKHFPLYRLFYQLPMISSIRNPNKFLHLFQIGVAILAAAGLDRAQRADEEPRP
ncbi:MAG: hypothetical protein K9N49_08430 [Candidatus Marinimicrobia bacterium]|nr:hypothetical protein [Candidatus Neomarinimicrobiota bacterium]